MELIYKQGDLVRVRDPKYTRFGGLLMGSVLFTGRAINELNRKANTFEKDYKLTYKNVLRGIRNVAYYDVPLFGSYDMDNHPLSLFPREHIAVHIFDKVYISEQYKTSSRIIILTMNLIELLPYQRDDKLTEISTGETFRVNKILNRFEANKIRFKPITNEVRVALQSTDALKPNKLKEVSYLDLMDNFTL